MVDFSNAKIYKLVCSETKRNYIGATITSLGSRLSKHKNKFNSCRTKDFVNPTIHLIEEYSCNNRKELDERERYYIENTQCVNHNIPGRTPHEYRRKNASKKRKYNKQYSIDNYERLKEYRRQYILNNYDKIHKKNDCICGGKFINKHKNDHFKTQKHLKYLENNI